MALWQCISHLPVASDPSLGQQKLLNSREHGVQSSLPAIENLGGRVSLQSITYAFYSTTFQGGYKSFCFSLSMTIRQTLLFDSIPEILLLVIGNRKMTLTVEKHIFRNVLSISFAIIISQSLYNINLSTESGY